MPLNRGVVRDQIGLQKIVFEISSRFLMIYKFLLSFSKKNWELDDYPIQTYFMMPISGSQNEKLIEKGKLLDLPWMAKILNWPLMFGLGATHGEALEKLRENFEKFRGEYKIPRPGTFNQADLVLAPHDEAKRLYPLAVEFFKTIFDTHILFFNDEDTLSNFQDFLDGEDVYQKIVENFDVDVSDIADGNIVKILKRIQENRNTQIDLDMGNL